MNSLDSKQRKLARAILKIEPTARIGDGVHAAAALVLDEELEYEAGTCFGRWLRERAFQFRPMRQPN